MVSNTLLIFSTVDGHTREICEHLAETLGRSGHRATLRSMDDGADIDLSAFDRIVIGASIRYGKHRRNVVEFINRNKALLASRPAVFFSVSLVARKPQRNRVETNPYVRRFLETIDWQPDVVAVFAGKLDYPRYGFWDRQMIRLIMWMTGGPTDPHAVVDYTDWQQVKTFGQAVAALPLRVG
jgi:menaquinone-dependent protoporphyrinogen oxidase